MAYPVAQVREEVAYLSYHFHWTLTEILELPHSERVAWVGQLTKINETILAEEEAE